MKRFDLTPLFASATLFLAAPLPGQETMRTMPPEAATTMGGPTAKAAVRRAELLKRYDKNGDGRIDDDERIEAKEEMLKENVDRQMALIAAGGATPEQMRTRLLELFDRNKDGALDADERAAAQTFAEQRAASADPQNAATRAELLRRFDQNGNARIDPEERGAIAEFLARNAGPAKPAGLDGRGAAKSEPKK